MPHFFEKSDEKDYLYTSSKNLMYQTVKEKTIVGKASGEICNLLEQLHVFPVAFKSRTIWNSRNNEFIYLIKRWKISLLLGLLC